VVWYWLFINVYYGWTVSESVLNKVAMQCPLTYVYRAQNIQTVIVGRFLQGAFGSTAATMVGGTIADIWAPPE